MGSDRGSNPIWSNATAPVHSKKQGSVWDIVVVGGGIAGTALAWRLLEAGQRVLIIDDGAPYSSSRIAAGLITPITGQRLVLNGNFDTLFRSAREFYREVERRTGRRFFYDRTAIRFLRSEAARANWRRRRKKSSYRAHLLDPQPDPLVDPDLADAGGGGFAMHSAQLDVLAYLDASHGVIPYARGAVDWERDVVLRSEEIEVLGYRSRIVISCEGHAAASNPHFSKIPFSSVAGDILTIRLHRRAPSNVIHCGVWLAPAPDPEKFMVGSTYRRHSPDSVPSVDARSRLERKLNAFWRVPYTVVDHRAAARPIIGNGEVLVDFLPNQPRIGMFNGLGSKGVLTAPWHAERLVQHMVQGIALPESARIKTAARDRCA